MLRAVGAAFVASVDGSVAHDPPPGYNQPTYHQLEYHQPEYHPSDYGHPEYQSPAPLHPSGYHQPLPLRAPPHAHAHGAGHVHGHAHGHVVGAGAGQGHPPHYGGYQRQQHHPTSPPQQPSAHMRAMAAYQHRALAHGREQPAAAAHAPPAAPQPRS
jgi:hypothetical protein